MLVCADDAQFERLFRAVLKKGAALAASTVGKGIFFKDVERQREMERKEREMFGTPLGGNPGSKTAAGIPRNNVNGSMQGPVGVVVEDGGDREKHDDIQHTNVFDDYTNRCLFFSLASDVHGTRAVQRF